ncbi:hypothetical protein FPHYL_13667 [Fusarium phyllophilum]|uniref:C2H2-type domain-containing protein n=1 Tax=Fusarium phyllophilum TaxID=47803 RepID=A0A8H5MLI7_9HYPO|nr:hypothetical protein FPHYL_13667 [Fusarium phyllophilum]
MERNPLSCDHCGEIFQRREHRDRHVLRHTGLKPFQCNICSKSFSRRSTTLLFVIKHCMVILGRREHVVVGGAKLVYLVQDRSRAVMADIHVRDVKIAIQKSSQDRDIAASSPLTAQGADYQEETSIPDELHVTSEEWGNSVSIPSDTKLYFEYFDSQFPFLHPSRLKDPDLTWILLLAVAAVGSHYSEIQGAEDYNTVLHDLLARAVELPVHDNILNVDATTVQCVFLLHVLWLFSGSHRDKVVLQHKRSSPATMCWDLIGKADKRRQSTQIAPHTEDVWQKWITEESELRLVTCVRVLECLSHIFLGTPLVFNLREATRQLPCAERLWRSRDASEWRSRQESSTGGQPKPDAFVAKAILLELFIDDRNYYRQLRTSQLLQSSFSSYMNSSANSDTQHAPVPSLPRPDTSRSENTLLDVMIDQLTLKNMSDSGHYTDTVFHVIAILRLIPLETLHSATGWETNKEQMMKSKMHLNGFFKNNCAKARKGLWHATCIFKETRSSRRLGCYDALSLTVAMGYIYCYSETRATLASTPTRPVMTRLDQLQDREAIERWIENGGDSVVHLTGVGILDGSDHCVRLLRDLERTLVSQIAWREFCRAFASSFAQLRRGETPTKSSREYNNNE